ncbi:S41 family peptidase [Bombella saccharophila]|uniref:S41 family peptidase n=1 Tax=Bombella saccharophila TaxID=2967338 RepID=A0ABT3W857_9PROT|nr:S41 family peptidase [Bombella saccharophila]MCX5615091.1 S41 family peptidase [Bombella saccharophila]
MNFRAGLMLGLACSTIGVASGVFLASRPALLPPAWAEDSAHKDATNAASNSDSNNAETVRMLTLLGTVMDIAHSEYVTPLPNKKLIRNAIDGMISNLDPHSSYMDAQQLKDMQDEMSGQFGGLGLQVQGDAGHVRVVSPIDDTPAARAGIQSGDVITMVDNKSIADLTLDQAVRKMRGKPGTQIILTILRPKTGKVQTITLKREIIHVQIVRSALYGRVGYIRLSEFDDDAEKELHKAYVKLVQSVAKTPGKTLSGLILDLRSDPGGKLDQAIAVSRDFVKDGEIVSIRGRHPEGNQHWDGVGKDITHGLPIIVLTNAGSASASEIVSGALKDHHRGMIMGERTFGKGSVQTIIPIADQGAIRLTTARYYTPSGRSIQGLGITPDIPVLASRDDDTLFTFHEADLAHTITNTDGKLPKETPRTDLPALAKTVERLPPAKWPSFDPTKPETDFQLQQALHLLNAMAGGADAAHEASLLAHPQVPAQAHEATPTAKNDAAKPGKEHHD